MANKKKKYNARFPPARIKKIMQKDDNVGKVAVTVPLIISRSLELFIEKLIKKSYDLTLSKKAKTLSIHHLKQVILADDDCNFLNDVLSKIPDFENAESEAVCSSNIDNTLLLNSYTNYAKTNSLSMNIDYMNMKTSRNYIKNPPKKENDRIDDSSSNFILKIADLEKNTISTIDDNNLSANNQKPKDQDELSQFNTANTLSKTNYGSIHSSSKLQNRVTNGEKLNEKIINGINKNISINNEQISLKYPLDCDNKHQSDYEAMDLTYSAKKPKKEKPNKHKSKKKSDANLMLIADTSTVPYPINIPSFRDFLNDMKTTDIFSSDSFMSTNSTLTQKLNAVNSTNPHMMNHLGSPTNLNYSDNFVNVRQPQNPLFLMEMNPYAYLAKPPYELDPRITIPHINSLQGLNLTTCMNFPHFRGIPYHADSLVQLPHPMNSLGPPMLCHSEEQLYHDTESLTNRPMDMRQREIDDRPSNVRSKKKKVPTATLR